MANVFIYCTFNQMKDINLRRIMIGDLSTDNTNLLCMNQ